MIILNGRRFVCGANALTATLFQPEGTASGFYKVKGREIQIFKPSGELDGVINGHGVLCKATPHNGRFWYNYASLDTVGRWPSYSEEVNDLCNARRMALAA